MIPVIKVPDANNVININVPIRRCIFPLTFEKAVFAQHGQSIQVPIISVPIRDKIQHARVHWYTRWPSASPWLNHGRILPHQKAVEKRLPINPQYKIECDSEIRISISAIYLFEILESVLMFLSIEFFLWKEINNNLFKNCLIWQKHWNIWELSNIIFYSRSKFYYKALWKIEKS